MPDKSRTAEPVYSYPAPRIGAVVIFKALDGRFTYGAAEYPALVTHVSQAGEVYVHAFPPSHAPFPYGPLLHKSEVIGTEPACWTERL